MAGSARRVVIEFLGKDKSLGRTADQVGDKTSKLGGRLKSVGKVAAGATAAGLLVAGKALFDVTKNAAEDQAAQVRLAGALKNNAKATDGQVSSVEKWITAQGKALGVTDDDLRPALGRLVRSTHDVGEAQRLSALAMDASAGTGKSLQTVSDALAKAHDGSTGALGRLGVKTKDAAGNALSFTQITKNMADTFKGQAEAKANTLQGKMGRLKLIFSETGESIGAKLIPVVTKMADWFLNKALPAAQRFGGWLSTRLGPIFAKVRAVVAKIFGGSGGMTGDIRQSMTSIRMIITSAVRIFTALWRRFGKYFVEYGRAAFKMVVGVIRGALLIINGVLKVFSGILRGDWRRAWDGVKDILRGAWTVIKAVVRGALSIIKALIRMGWAAVTAITRGAFTGLKNIARAGLNLIVDAVRSIPGRIRGLAGAYLSAGRAIIGALVNGLKNAGGVISGIAGNVWSAVRGMLNGAIDRINSALSFTISLPGPDIHINPPNIPHLAGGTSYHRGGWAVVGERGAELVRMPRGSKVYPGAQSRGMLGAGGAVEYHVHLHGPAAGDPRAYARAVIAALRAEKRLRGQPLGLA